MSGGGQVAEALEGLPLGEMLGSLATGLRRAQYDLDLMSIRITELMSGRYGVATTDGAGKTTIEERDSMVTFDGERVSLLELGLAPTFLQIVDTVFDVKLAISLHRDDSQERRRLDLGADAGVGDDGAIAHVTAVDARFSSRFQYTAEGASAISSRLVPVPAPAELMQVVHGLMDAKARGGGQR